MSDFPRHDFWDFSIRIYARPEVAEACLGLQDRHGLDVNVVLFCLWLGASGRGPLVGPELDQVLSGVADWHARTVRHLRALRKWLKGDLGAVPRGLGDRFRNAVAGLEIDAEHIEQLVLAGALARTPKPGLEALDGARDAASSLAAYLGASGASSSATDRAAAGLLLAAAFPELAPGELSRLARLERPAPASAPRG